VWYATAKKGRNLMGYLLLAAAIITTVALVSIKVTSIVAATGEQQLNQVDSLVPLRNLASDFGDALQRFNGYEVVDSRELPAPKKEIKQALQRLFLSAEDANMRNAIAGAYALLSMFQDGVGDPVRPAANAVDRSIPLPPENSDEAALAAWSEANGDAVGQMVLAIKAQFASIGDWSEIVTAEMNALNAEWSAFEAQHRK
jgi:hypothetical protein